MSWLKPKPDFVGTAANATDIGAATSDATGDKSAEDDKGK